MYLFLGSRNLLTEVSAAAHDHEGMNKPTRRTTAEDAAVLHAAAQRGLQYLRLPEDGDWLRTVEAGSLSVERRLQAMASRGSLASLGKHRWLILPNGASTIEQAAPLKVLLAAKFDGRADWYLGYLSALVDHRLTDIDPDDVYIGVRGVRMANQRIGARPVIVVHHADDDDWSGVERERVGRVTAYRSGVDRTLLDTLSHPRRCGPPEVWVRAWERAMREQRADPARLTDYAEQRSRVVRARLAFWLNQTGHPRAARRVLRALGGRVTGPAPLDATHAFGDGRWRRDRDTGLVVNMPERVIDGWLEYGK